jgi:hypothetical protein
LEVVGRLENYHILRMISYRGGEGISVYTDSAEFFEIIGFYRKKKSFMVLKQDSETLLRVVF